MMKPGATAIVWFDLWKVSDLAKLIRAAGFERSTMIDWLKTNPVPINSRKTYLSNAREVAAACVKPGAQPIFNRETVSRSAARGLFEFPIQGGKGRFHPTEKSLPLFEEIIRLLTNEAGVVLDCFSGSGTTAMACQRTGRRFVGSELDPEYHRKSMERLAAAAAPAAPAKARRKKAS